MFPVCHCYHSAKLFKQGFVSNFVDQCRFSNAAAGSSKFFDSLGECEAIANVNIMSDSADVMASNKIFFFLFLLRKQNIYNIYILKPVYHVSTQYWNLGIRDTQGTVNNCPEFRGGLMSQVHFHIMNTARD